MEPQNVVFLLLAGHFFGDYAFQSAYIACGKNRKKPLEGTSWFHPMLAHSYIHGTFVFFFTGGCLTLALLEIACHFVIDDSKCSGRFGEHVDQALHVGCKLLWAFLLFNFPDYLPW